MAGYFLRRILYAIPTLLGVNILVFLLFFAVNTPDHMAKQALGEKASTPEQILRWKTAHGYDMPLLFNGAEKGLRKVSRTLFYQKSLALFWGQFGKSDSTGEPIWTELKRRIGPSLCLMIPIFFASLLVNLFFAMTAAAHRGSWWDLNLQVTCVAAMSISSLIYIIVGQYLFGAMLRLVPVSGFLPGWDMVRFLVLPVMISVVASIGGEVRFFRTLFLEEMEKDYVRTARAKGLPEERVLFVHVLKNALIPILTNVPMQMLMLVMGSVLLENFFSIPGMGGFTIKAVIAQDFSVVRVMVFLGAVLYMIGLVLTDCCYLLVDPRVRLR